MSEWKQDFHDADAIKDRAADWLWRQDAPDWSSENQAQLNDWLAQSRYHLATYWRLKAAWTRTERLAALKPARNLAARPISENRLWPRMRFVAAACAIFALCLVGTYRWTFQEKSYATAVGQQATVTLADGSRVQLNTNSEISVSVGLGKRAVVLKRGEAFFRVRHDAARPFTVVAAGHRITDLGTEFSVRASGDRLQVMLVEGRVRLEAASSQVHNHATDMMPGEIAIATQDSLSVTKPAQRTLVNALAWRQGKIVFSHKTLAEAADEFNRYNNTKLVVQPEIANLKVSGTFGAGSVGPFTTMAKLAFGLRIQSRGHDIVLSREKS